MLPMLPVSVPTLVAQSPAPSPEPDGSRALGVVPPFHGHPAPPDWLRATSHALAAPHCRHYLYEAYAEAGGAWLVRYVAYPEADEPDAVREQLLLFPPGQRTPAEALAPVEVHCHALTAVWHARTFTLADRRDLLR